MKIKKEVIVVLFIIMLIITILQINSTYAKYFEEVNTNYNISVKRWNIILNNKEIYNETNLNNILNPNLMYDTNINDNILAPGRKGYFYLELDVTQVDVKFETKFNIAQEEKTELSDFKLSGYSKIEGETESEITKPNTQTKDVSIIINPEDITPINDKKIQKIKIYFEWYDKEDNNLDNTNDTDFKGVTDTETNLEMLKFKADLTFKQYVD